jgi:hypothetical protein
VEVACDNDGNSYWIGHDAAGITGVVVKRNLAGAVQWSNSLTSRGISICVDADGRVYTGEEQGTVSCFNSGGVLQWAKTINSGYTIRALAVDYSAGFLYAATGSGFDGAYRLSTSTGGYARIWTSLYGDVSGIAIDEGSPTSLYIGTDNGYLAKISTAGYEYWNSGGPIRASADIHCVRVGHDGYGYCATGAAKTIEKFVLSSGGLSWVAPPTGGAGTCSYGCAPDQFGNVYGTWYITGTSPNNLLKKIKSTGVVDWSWQPYTSAQMFGVAVSPGIKAAGM